jgi:hypothetical protein
MRVGASNACTSISLLPSILIAAASLVACDRGGAGTRDGSPRDHLPDYVREISELGAALRPAWSADGSRFLYLDDLVGDVHEYELASRRSRPLTGHFEHLGFTRAHYLSNGDILLCGPASVDADDPERGRWRTDFWLLDGSLEEPAVLLGEKCFEGPAVSRQEMRIAWVRTDYPDRLLRARSELWTGEVATGGAAPRIVHARKLVDRSDLYYLGMLEPQDFRPPDERELIFTAYGYRGGEVMGVDLQSGALENYSRSWWYEEAEGVSPGGGFTLVEREFTLWMKPRGAIDLWLLRLDGTGEFARMTHFSEFRGFGANNPVISPDCRTMLFALREEGGLEGNSAGLFLYDLEKSPLTPPDLCGNDRRE